MTLEWLTLESHANCADCGDLLFQLEEVRRDTETGEILCAGCGNWREEGSAEAEIARRDRPVEGGGA